MALHLWFTFALAYLATTLSPGPNVLLVVRNALRYGPPAMAVTLLGNLGAQLLVTSGVALGVGAILIAVPTAFLALKVVGAGYLIYLGVRQLLARTPVARPAGEEPTSLPASKWKIGMEAFLVSASNPKTLIFLCAFLPQFLDHDQPIAGQFLTMYLTIAAIVVIVHSVYCYTAYRFSKRLSSAHWVAALKRTTGAIFIGLGVRLLNTKAL
ncbi:LysE family translocator [Pseudomonas gingeri]|uniref:LysE family translocator n=1 Tax=Pseudomonas gingeri TaxID=117681 RepID=UPI0015A12E49|nr:LysE family translocator [Pseudomonas gingeri]NWA24849.1 LysE family translocator [Pseudomonas gingeri]NWD71679.1 LysE family translocator [Pseudomonas gingeri]NWD74858.1 LysE family translocator [Pseudomonas gingeri]